MIAKYKPPRPVGWVDEKKRTGKPRARIRLTQAPYLESTANAAAEDWYDEGFQYLTEQDALVFGQRPSELWQEWREQPHDMWVVRFELLEVLA